ncbi:MAG: deoxyribose-phosphate aldolase [Bacteroidales bacterium]|nr:deoxyribose-phosphate aldolase [Bacteroidales bacterium]MDY2931529.1 deoxyribose-phosphate aldolase [Muribaculaceae bacterium]MDD6132193.1 deoxyribose-phosphate aldolase [Bacteroidales bacterium]MDD6850910.1 deoxyribose-phosphate aldolase [Bacteroidales bacterium]MDD7404929.1 deoxyribose-phosphate aldolase [Bacteroidales bacterium]
MEEIKDKYQQAIASFSVPTDDAVIAQEVSQLLAQHVDENRKNEVYQFMLNCIDLTTLSSTDTQSSVRKFVQRVNDFDNNYPQYKNVAAICTYANFADVVRNALDVDAVKVAVCSANFPSSQAHLEVKTAETALAIADGADEVDIVFNLGLYFDNNYEDLCDEISEIKQACGDKHLKVILETGALKTAEHIRNASVLAMYSGADFIKTSTGKIYDGASVEAAYVMCRCIKEYYEKHGEMIGFKASGGISTTEDAIKYYTIVKEVLGEKWLTNEYFRIGASRLANALFIDITNDVVKPF